MDDGRWLLILRCWRGGAKIGWGRSHDQCEALLIAAATARTSARSFRQRHGRLAGGAMESGPE
jgi:hypothetical protein